MEARTERHANAVWRVGPDRVLVRAAYDSDPQTWDLFGSAALVWTAISRPMRPDEIVANLGGLRVPENHVRAAISDLAAAGLLTVVE